MSYIKTYSGHRFDYEDIENNFIDIFDIAHGLSNTCRFSGQCNSFYSVAQHSVLVSYQVPPYHAFEALMHDAAEAYMCDIPTPLKVLLPGYKELEDKVLAKVWEVYQLSGMAWEDIKIADRELLRAEFRDLLKHTYEEGEPMLLQNIVPWSPQQAEQLFLDRFTEVYRPPVQKSA